jgi:hypothetical protein
MPSYILPQVLVYQEFILQPVALDLPQRACIIGEQFNLHRYSVAGEKAACRLKTTNGTDVIYDPTSDNCYPWPGKTAGEIPDEDYTRVYFDDALLQYFHDPIGSGSPIYWVSPEKNRIRADNLIWQTANGYTRSAALLRDVKIGDVIQLLTSACGSVVTLESVIIGLIADVIPAVIDSAEVEVSNHIATSLTSSNSQETGPFNNVMIDSVDPSSYNGLADGYPSETYHIEVIGASIGDDATTAILKLVSGSGLDDVATFSPAAFGAPTAIGTRGLTVTFGNSSSSSSPTPGYDLNDFQVGQKWRVDVSQAFSPSTPASSGTYIGSQDMTYIIEVSRGGHFTDANKPLINVTTNIGQDISGPTEVTASAAWVSAGNLGVLVNFTGAALCKGDRYYIPVVAAAPGAVRTLALANNLPDAMRGECIGSSSSSSVPTPDLDVKLFIKKNMEVTENRTGYAPLVNWTQSETEVCLQDNILGYDSSWVNSLGQLVALPVTYGKPYVTWRGRLSTWCNTVGTVTQVSDVPAALGTVDPDNPLAFGVYNALLNANGEEVKFLGVCSHSPVTLDDWLYALDLLVGRDDVYSLVPLTQEKTVHDAVNAHVLAESTPENGRWRIGWYNRAAEEIIGVYAATTAGDPVLGTITDDPDTSGTQYTLVEITGGQLLTNSVRSGDILRTNYTSDGFGNYTYSEYVIDVVINEETCRLMSGPASPINVPQKMEIWRQLSKTELATQLAGLPGQYTNRRAYLIWPDVVGNAGVTFPGYFLCCALAGLRSGVLPHQGLTNVEIIGFDDMSRTTDLFSATQLNLMASSGYWIVTEDPNDGTIYTRHQLSCGDQSDVNQREQSITTNVDHISYTILNRMKTYIGRGNVTQVMVDIVFGEMLSIMDEFRNTIVVDRLGPQLNAYQILELRQHPTFKDRITTTISIVPPAPFNNLEVHLQIS